jgi:lysophospholipase L1-like esterase
MFYDINNQAVQFYNNSSNIAEIVQATSPDIAYAIASVRTQYNTFNYMLQVTDTDTTEQEIEFLPYNKKINIPYITDNTLLNKSLVNFGDSIAAGANGTSYGQQIANNNQMTYNSYAVGGALLANDNNHSSIQTQVDTFLQDNITPDFILINGGTNDILNVELGEITNFYVETSSNIWDTTKTAGALEKILFNLKSNRPSSKIIFVIPHRMNTRDNNLQNQWFSLIKEICKKWSVPVASIFDDGNLNTNIVAMRTYTDSGTHPTTEGYTKFYVPLVKNKMLEIN